MAKNTVKLVACWGQQQWKWKAFAGSAGREATSVASASTAHTLASQYCPGGSCSRAEATGYSWGSDLDQEGQEETEEVTIYMTCVLLRAPRRNQDVFPSGPRQLPTGRTRAGRATPPVS